LSFLAVSSPGIPPIDSYPIKAAIHHYLDIIDDLRKAGFFVID
jgi:hypothetical protein